jgi:4'-phosphopantetheinyl transferase
MLAEITQSSASEWRFSKLRSGLPIARHQGGKPAPAISMSHSGAWVAYAATFAGEIGIDIEQVRHSRNHLGIAEHAFGVNERAAVSSSVPARFYAIWTLREAIAKANGAGLEMAADGRDRVQDGPYNSSKWATLENADWWLMHTMPAPDVSLSAAFRPADGQLPEEMLLHWWPVGE